MVAGSGRSYTVRHEEWALPSPVHQTEISKAYALMEGKATEHDADLWFRSRDDEVVIGFSYTMDDACPICRKPYELNRLHVCRGPALPHTHDPDGDGTDDCAACTVADDAREVRKADR